MTYSANLYAQDSGLGRVEQVLSAIAAASADAEEYTNVDVAVAYASDRGVVLLDRRLSLSRSWESARKRFLVAIDFGITEPAALKRLAAMANAEVRVPNAHSVVNSINLCPSSTFHAKTYLFRSAEWRSPSALVVGSANLTASALLTGAEVVVKQSWTNRLSRSDRRHLQRSRSFLDWFDLVWASAPLLVEVLDVYEARYQQKPQPRPPSEEDAPSVRDYLASPEDAEVSGALSVQLRAAKGLWVRTDELYHNRGVEKPGNQIDLPRGTRVFFGFPGGRVAKNHIFGDINIRIRGHQAVSRSVRFGNNEMDKVNLPIPEVNGLEGYDHSYLIFERSGTSEAGTLEFELTVTDQIGHSARVSAAANHLDLVMGSGREYGLLF